MKMPAKEYDGFKQYIIDRFRYGKGTKEEYVSLINRIVARYEDGEECAKQLDKYQDKWTVFK